MGKVLSSSMAVFLVSASNFKTIQYNYVNNTFICGSCLWNLIILCVYFLYFWSSHVSELCRWVVYVIKYIFGIDFKSKVMNLSFLKVHKNHNIKQCFWSFISSPNFQRLYVQSLSAIRSWKDFLYVPMCVFMWYLPQISIRLPPK